ncbi:ABC1 kinase family protein [Flavitalea flava]
MLLKLLRRGGQVSLYTFYYGFLFLFSRKRPAGIPDDLTAALFTDPESDDPSYLHASPSNTLAENALAADPSLPHSRRKLRPGLSRPVVIRKYFQACGGGFIKLGQILAMRYDLLPEYYCLELSSLLDKLPSIPFDQIKNTLGKEFGRPPEELYESINPVALATASIAQVHSARLITGEQVVIKVLLPHARQDFEIDLRLLKVGCHLLNTFGFWGNIAWQQMVTDITQLTREEMDFRKEARNIREMHDKMLADDIAHYAPKLYPDLCGREVITMEKIEGVSVNALLNAMDKGEEEKLAAWKEEGITPRRTACILLRSFLEQSMNFRFFQADPHAANLIVMKGGELAWIDFGMLGWLDEKLWTAQYHMRLALAQKNIQRAYSYFVQTLGTLPDKDLSVFETEIKGHLQDWVWSASMPGATLVEKSSGFFFMKIFATVRKEGIAMPMNMVRLYRAILILDMVMLRLYPEIDWVEIMKEFLVEKEQRRIIGLTAVFADPGFYSRILEATAIIPDAVYNLAEWLREGLPLLRRDITAQLTRMDRTWLSFFRMARNGFGFFTLYLFIHRVFGLSGWYKGTWENTGIWLTDHALALGIGSLFLFIFWNSLARSFK